MRRPAGIVNVGVIPICYEGCNALAESREGEKDTTAHFEVFRAAEWKCLVCK